MEIIPEDFISRSQMHLNRIKENSHKYSLIEQAEVYEMVGICQYFNGQFREALTNLDMSLRGQYEALKPMRQVCYIKLLVILIAKLLIFMATLISAEQLGSIHFRFGNMDKADNILKAANNMAMKLKNTEYIVVSLTNLAIVNLRLKKYGVAIKYSREAVDVVAENYSTSSHEVLYRFNYFHSRFTQIVFIMQYIIHSRVLLSIYLKAGELTKAEVLLADKIFSEKGFFPNDSSKSRLMS